MYLTQLKIYNAHLSLDELQLTYSHSSFRVSTLSYSWTKNSSLMLVEQVFVCREKPTGKFPEVR